VVRAHDLCLPTRVLPGGNRIADGLPTDAEYAPVGLRSSDGDLGVTQLSVELSY
jgi:hypothetical protein